MKPFRCKDNHCLHRHIDNDWPPSNIIHYCCKCRLVYEDTNSEIEKLCNAFSGVARTLEGWK